MARNGAHSSNTFNTITPPHPSTRREPYLEGSLHVTCCCFDKTSYRVSVHALKSYRVSYHVGEKSYHVGYYVGGTSYHVSYCIEKRSYCVSVHALKSYFASYHVGKKSYHVSYRVGYKLPCELPY